MGADPEPSDGSIRSRITRELVIVAAEQGRTLAPLTDELKLFESGLDSLALAIVVSRLADSLGVDPWATGGSVDAPVTFGDFVRLYEGARG